MKPLLIALPMLLALTALEANAGERNHTTTMTNAHGTFSRNTHLQTSANGFERNRVTTGPGGQSREMHSRVNVDADQGVLTRERTTVRANGSTLSSDAQVVRTENGYQRSISRSNGNGASVETEVDVSVDREAKSLTKEITVVDASGASHSNTITHTVTKGDANP
ncbi:hypothetical protein [Halioxenophilus sp. WMMB6]|uniref:hypothetical protein n=1 Tax=Halioxenophilus sp. WMMB6 TaxID=3073815 RepID=UPI00295E2232|nr:hypothetical protein [Halioxenophilus sp. WMMB6]